jgi:hypothetical protein
MPLERGRAPDQMIAPFAGTAPMTDGAATSPDQPPAPEPTSKDGPLAAEFIALAEAIGRGLARGHYATEQRRSTRQKPP